LSAENRADRASGTARVPIIAVDAMGGDDAPEAIVAGALLAHRDGLGRIVLVGDRARIEPLLAGERDIEIVHSAGVVPMDASASQAVRKSEGTSLGDAVDLVRDGLADAVVSAGNSGAFLAIALIRLRTIPGIARPAIGAVLPGRFGPVVLCDAGANVDCKPEWLLQFGMMGSAYARAALGIAEPRVAVISVGEEPTKGNAQSIEAAALLAAAPLRFVGNIEGNDILQDHADVVVADGFVGNVILKTAEGSAKYFRDVLRESYESAGIAGKLGAFFSRAVFAHIRVRLDYSTYGGAPLLGVRGNCVVAHGRSDRTAIRNAIRQAATVAEHDLVGSIGAVVQEAAVGASRNG
jgi:glycerol-3-phosphate acyltransferase PlsX